MDVPPPLRARLLEEKGRDETDEFTAAQAKRLEDLECPDFITRPWVKGSVLSRRRVAIVSSAGLVVRGEAPFRGRDADYRVIPADTRPARNSLLGRKESPVRMRRELGCRRLV